MKKWFARVLCLVMAVSLLVGLTGCGEQSKFVGSWKATMDLTEQMNKTIAAQGEVASYLLLDKFELVLDITFNTDGTYKREVNQDALTDTIDNMKESYKQGLTKYFEDVIKKNNMGVTVDQLLASSGTDLQKMLDEIFTENMSFDDMTKEFNSEGNFKVADGKLFLSAGLEYSVDEEVYHTYEITENELKLLEYHGEDADEMDKEMYPLVFKRQ